LSQRDLSSLVASSRESVNKQLRAWRESGMVELREGHLLVLKPTSLRLLAG
jgi:CRP-like cAMP-binding protein